VLGRCTTLFFQLWGVRERLQSSRILAPLQVIPAVLWCPVTTDKPNPFGFDGKNAVNMTLPFTPPTLSPSIPPFRIMGFPFTSFSCPSSYRSHKPCPWVRWPVEAFTLPRYPRSSSSFLRLERLLPGSLPDILLKAASLEFPLILSPLSLFYGANLADSFKG